MRSLDSRVSECVSALFRNEHFNTKANVFRRFARASAFELDLRGAVLVSDLHSQIRPSLPSLTIWETPEKNQKISGVGSKELA